MCVHSTHRSSMDHLHDTVTVHSHCLQRRILGNRWLDCKAKRDESRPRQPRERRVSSWFVVHSTHGGMAV